MSDGQTNGNGAHVLAPTEYATFKIGGRELKVPALNLWDLEQSRDDIRSLSPEMPWTEYAATVIRIVARKLSDDDKQKEQALWESLLKGCSYAEAQGIAGSFGELLTVTGFLGQADQTDSPLGDQTLSLGTGTATESQPNLPLPLESSTSSS